MSKLQSKIDTAIGIIERTLLYPLKSQIFKQIETNSEKEIDKILSESEYRSNFVQSILQQVIVTKNIEQQVIPLSQDQTTPSVLPKPVKSKQSRKKSGKESTVIDHAKPEQSTKKKASNKKEVTNKEIIQVAERLKNATSREEGQAIIDEINYTVEQLKLLAKHLGISGINGLKKAGLIEKIIQDTIGYRIDSAIIQNHK